MRNESNKKERTFSFNYELSELKIENLKLIKRPVGVLSVEGMGYHWAYPDTEFSIDIDFIKWNGTDIKPVLEVLDCWALATIQEATLSWVSKNLFQDASANKHEAETSVNLINDTL